jgi:hypothetical protein
MSNPFFEHPILNSPYENPVRHWELGEHGQPTQKILEKRRSADFITPIPKPRKRKTVTLEQLIFDEGKGLHREDFFRSYARPPKTVRATNVPAFFKSDAVNKVINKAYPPWPRAALEIKY